MRISDKTLSDIWKRVLYEICEGIFTYSMEKPLPADWAEANLYLPPGTTPYPGPLSYNLTPYAREIVNHFHPTSTTRSIAIMKGSQSGITATVVIPAILYIISQIPENIFFTAADKLMAARTIAERLDPIIAASGLSHLIRPNVIKKGNSKTGDTAYAKEFAGGNFTAAGTNNPDAFRFFSAKFAIPDDYDAAPRAVGKEGAIDKLIMGRQKAYGNDALTCYVSTPTIKGASNIEDVFLKGTQKKWNWQCPSCKTYVPVEWLVKMPDGTKAGMVYKLDDKRQLIKSSIHFRTQCCGHLIDYEDKYDLNLAGIWIPSVSEPLEENFESYHLNDIFIPPGFDNWEVVVKEWLEANPPGRPSNVNKLITFNNIRLGLPFEQMGETPKVTRLMKNTRDYLPGTVPDLTCEEDGNEKIVLITLSCDLNGFMEEDNEDVRLDWELVAYSVTGVTYSIDHGSIGTHKRERDKKAADKAKEDTRMKWTLKMNSVGKNEHGERVNNSVWVEFEALMDKVYTSEAGIERNVAITTIDLGFGSKYAMPFILKMQEKGHIVFGIKGKTEQNYRPVQKDTQPVRHSKERPKQFYIAEVNQIKDELSINMNLTPGEDFIQPAGFMNFPQQNAGKYSYEGFFMHFEGEKRIEVKEGDEIIGYQWKKKNDQSANHFWDVRIYSMCAVLIYLDQIVKSNPSKYKNLTWEEFVLLVAY